MLRAESGWDVADRSEVVDAVMVALAAGQAVLVRGAAGVGKTTLINLVSERLTSAGAEVVRLDASTADGPVPYGGLARLQPSGAVLDAAAAADLLDHLLGESVTRKVVIIDDLPLLDEASVAVVADVVVAGTARLLAVARTTAALPKAMDRVLAHADVHSIEVAPLSNGQLQRAVSAWLGGPPNPATLTTIALLSGGIPLHARELVESALEAGTLEPEADGWSFTEPPPASPSLVELVAARVARLPADQRRAFEVIAAAEPLPLDAATQLAGSDVLGALESAGLVHLESSPSGRNVRLAHPLYAEVIRAQLGPLALRSAAARAADALRDHGADSWRTTCLRLEHHLPIPQADAIDAARRALAVMDTELALRFADAAGQHFDALLVRGAAHAARGEVSAAEHAFYDALELAQSDGDRARVISRLANTLVTAGGRFQEAVELSERAIEGIADPHWADFLRADLTYARSWTGAPTAAPVAATDNPATRANECLVGAVVAVMQGDLDTTHALVAEGLPLVPAIAADVPAARDLLTLSRFLALAFGGRSEASRSLVSAELERASARSDVAAGTWLAVRAIQRLFDGDALGAIGDAQSALPRLAIADIGGLHPMTLAVRALAEARLGNVADAAATLAEIPEPWRVEPKVKVLSAAADAWCQFERGDAQRAAGQFGAAGKQAISDHHTVFGAFVAYEAVRIGRARAALDVLRHAGERCAGDLVAALLEHAEALEAGDGDRLLAVADRLPAVGFTLGAAEAAAQAADRFTLAGNVDRAVRARYVASATLARIPGARSPIADGSGGLTRREVEIAAHAARGHSSREIAAALGISTRTVDNHLAAVFRKLGIASRAALRQHVDAIAGGADLT